MHHSLDKNSFNETDFLITLDTFDKTYANSNNIFDLKAPSNINYIVNQGLKQSINSCNLLDQPTNSSDKTYTSSNNIFDLEVLSNMEYKQSINSSKLSDQPSSVSLSKPIYKLVSLNKNNCFNIKTINSSDNFFSLKKTTENSLINVCSNDKKCMKKIFFLSNGNTNCFQTDKTVCKIFNFATDIPSVEKLNSFQIDQKNIVSKDDSIPFSNCSINRSSQTEQNKSFNNPSTFSVNNSSNFSSDQFILSSKYNPNVFIENSIRAFTINKHNKLKSYSKNNIVSSSMSHNGKDQILFKDLNQLMHSKNQSIIKSPKEENHYFKSLNNSKKLLSNNMFNKAFIIKTKINSKLEKVSNFHSMDKTIIDIKDKNQIHLKKIEQLDIINNKQLKQKNNESHFISKQKKLFVCEICGKSFGKTSAIIEHLRFHNGEKLHECPNCGKRFTIGRDLTKHRRIHTGEKPHQCQICGLKMSTGREKADHRRLHQGGNKCPICGKTFTRLHNMNEHIKGTHQGLKLHQCPLCDKQFAYSCSLRYHKKNSHN